ncbi:UDP-sugar-dependent glycosyltransferase 52 [Hordeum vulgare]|nr:UDP-sugar-dependent glycosyltransferase 52 [Hordeum vulgare]
MFTHCSLHLRSVGISCRPEEKIFVAQLSLSESNLPAKMEAELCLLRSNEWELLRNLQIKYEAHELSDLIYWRTDRVLPFENYLCWVSYFSGGERAIDKVSVIAVDTISKHVVIHQYIKGEEDLEGEADDMVRRKSRLLHPFVPSEFPKFFWPHQLLSLWSFENMVWDLRKSCCRFWESDNGNLHRSSTMPGVIKDTKITTETTGPSNLERSKTERRKQSNPADDPAKQLLDDKISIRKKVCIPGPLIILVITLYFANDIGMHT